MKRAASLAPEMALGEAGGEPKSSERDGCHEIVIDGTTMLEAVEAIVSSDDGTTTNVILEDSGGDAAQPLFNQLQEGLQVGVIAQHMDITEPLSTLRTLLEQRLAVSLQDYAFFLQDTQELNASKNLVDQCVQGEGLVQVNVEIINKDGVKKINIVDVLKPAEELLAVPPNVVQQAAAEEEQEEEEELIGEPPVVRKVVLPENEEAENVTRWIISSEFRKEQEKHKIPLGERHCRHWLVGCSARLPLLGRARGDDARFGIFGWHGFLLRVRQGNLFLIRVYELDCSSLQACPAQKASATEHRALHFKRTQICSLFLELLRCVFHAERSSVQNTVLASKLVSS